MSVEWIKQSGQPLFPDILWNRPLNRKTGKQLLIMGGHSKQFSIVQQTYQAALAAGIGQAKSVLPDSLRPYLGNAPDCLLVRSTPAGSFARGAYEPIRGYLNESDGLLLPGDLSKNPETTSLVERLLSGTGKPVFITPKVIEASLERPMSLLNGSPRIIIGTLSVLKKLAKSLDIGSKSPTTNLLGKISFIKTLPQQTTNYVMLDSEITICSNGKVSVTAIHSASPRLFAVAGAAFATFWLQQANKFEALTTAAFVIAQLAEASTSDTTLITKLSKILSDA